MDINKIIENNYEKPIAIQESALEQVSSPPYPRDTLEKRRADLQRDALLAIKRDPAVLEAKVAVKDQCVSDVQKVLLSLSNMQKVSMKVSQPTKKPNGVQPRKIPEYRDRERERSEFERKMCMERAAMLSLAPEQFTLLLKYVATLRQQRVSAQKKNECGFCKRNGHPEVWYNTHQLKNCRGRVQCPVLRALVCPLCGATGDRAHTASHCSRSASRR